MYGRSLFVLLACFWASHSAWASENTPTTCSCQCSMDGDRVVQQVTDLQERLICVENTLDAITGGHGPNHRAIGLYHVIIMISYM